MPLGDFDLAPDFTLTVGLLVLGGAMRALP